MNCAYQFSKWTFVMESFHTTNRFELNEPMTKIATYRINKYLLLVVKFSCDRVCSPRDKHIDKVIKEVESTGYECRQYAHVISDKNRTNLKGFISFHNC